MFCALKKTLGLCLVGIGVRNIAGFITSVIWLAICSWRSYYYYWSNLVMLLNTKKNVEVCYENCC